MSQKWFKFWVTVLVLECFLVGGGISAREYQKHETKVRKEERIRKIKQIRLEQYKKEQMKKQEALLFLERQMPLFEMDCIVHTHCETVDE